MCSIFQPKSLFIRWDFLYKMESNDIWLDHHLKGIDSKNKSKFWPKMAKKNNLFHIGFLWMILKESIGGGFLEHFKAYKSPILKKFESPSSRGLIPI